MLSYPRTDSIHQHQGTNARPPAGNKSAVPVKIELGEKRKLETLSHSLESSPQKLAKIPLVRDHSDSSFKNSADGDFESFALRPQPDILVRLLEVDLLGISVFILGKLF